MMGLISLTIWIVYGLIVGAIAKAIHPGKEPGGFFGTLLIGVAGSFTGGFINWCMGRGVSPLQASGLLFGIIGGVVFLFAWEWWKKFSSSEEPTE